MADVNLQSSEKSRVMGTIADQIREDLKAYVAFGKEFPVPLTLAALANHYQVSVTPVRHALARLIEEESLVKLPNGRLTPGKQLKGAKPSDPQQSPIRPEPLNAALERQIIHLSLTGKEIFLREEAAAKQFAVSRTVIRQAFNCLVGRGIIEHVPRRGWRIRPFHEDDMLAYLDVRETLECKALELARPHLVSDDLESMLAGNQRGSYFELDNRLHAYWIERSGNRYIQDFFAHNGVYYTALFDHATLESEYVADMAKQHCLILEALISRQWASARRALIAHIHAQKPIVRHLLALASQNVHAVS